MSKPRPRTLQTACRPWLAPACVALAALQSACVAWPAPTPAPGAVQARAAQILAGMTLAQKVGQMTQPEIRAITPAQVRQHYIGSVLNGGGSWPGERKDASPAQWLALAQAYHQASMSTDMPVPVPLVWGTDAMHGHNNVMGATLFPHNIGLGAADNPALVREIGVATARAVRATGIAWAFAPTLAVVRDNRWGRTYESYAEDPATVARLGGAMVQGLQHGLGTPGAAQGVLATAKHFIGDGGTEQGIDQGITRATPDELLHLHGAGYRAAIAAGVHTVMVSFNSWFNTANGSDRGKLHGSQELLTGLLKHKLGFEGFVVSDWNGIGQVPGCTATACAAAINAGIDMFMVPDDWQAFITNTIAHVQGGQIPMARIDDAVMRILRVKLRAGLFDAAPARAAGAGDMAALQARELARRAVRESLVLLKNNAGVLPLQRQARLLVVGRAAHSLAMQSGGWSLSWQGRGHTNADFPGGSTVLDGLRAAGAQVVYSADAQGVDPAAFDAVVAVLGEQPYAEGAGDIPASGTLQHSTRHPEDLAVLQRVAGRGKPVVTVLLSGRVLYVNDLLNLSDAFVAAWLPGTEGAGITDLLLRAPDGSVAHDFRGRLSFSWPKAPCQVPLNAGDAGYAPLFPLGYGLSVASRGTLPLLEAPTRVGGCGTAGDLLIFQQAAVPPYGLVLARPAGAPRDWPDEAVPVDPTLTQLTPAQAPALRVSTVELSTQHDAKLVAWLRPARLVAWSGQRAALGAYPDAALVFDLQVRQAPDQPVHLAMECEYPCAGTLDLTRFMRSAAGQGTRRVKLPLACFAEAGLDLRGVDVPFSLSADAPFTAAFARIRIVAGAARDADAARCADFPVVKSPR